MTVTIDKVDHRLSSNSNLNLNTSLNVDNDLLNSLRGGMEIDQPLVDAHFKFVPCLGTFTVGSLSGGDCQGLGWETDRTLHVQRLRTCSLDQFLADLLKAGNFARRKGNANLVDFRAFAEILLRLLERHFELRLKQ